MGRKVAIVDLEATNNDYDKNGRIIQIGAVILEDGNIIDKKSMLINPKCEIPSSITQLTGITQEAVNHAPTFRQIAQLWYHILKDCIFVAHNIEFDYVFLQKHFAEEGINYHAPGLDTVKLARIFLPEAPSYNLSELAMYLQIPFGKAHDAFDDAMTTTYLLHEIAIRVANLSMKHRLELRRFIKCLPHDEIELMKSPKTFMLHNGPLKIVEGIKENTSINLSEYDSQEARYILEKWTQYKQLVMEPTRILFTARQKLAFANELFNDITTKRTLIVCENKQQLIQIKELLSSEKVYELKTSMHYLNDTIFETLLSSVDEKQLNVMELITIATLLYWKTYSDSEDLDTLNIEVSYVNSIVKKYISKLDVKKVTLNLPLHVPYMLMTYDIFQELFALQEDWSEYRLVVFDLPSCVLFLRNIHQKYLPLDKWKKKMETLKERMEHLKIHRTYAELYSQILNVMSRLNCLEKLFVKLLKKNTRIKQSQRLASVEYCLDHSNASYQAIYEQLHTTAKEIKQLNVLSELLENSDMLLPKEVFPMLSADHLMQFMLDENEQMFWQVKGQVRRLQVEGVSLCQLNAVLSSDLVEWFQQFGEAIMLSDAQYRYRQPMGWHHELRYLSYGYHCLPQFKKFQSHLVNIPIEYVGEKNRSRNITQFINDYEEELSDHIIIVALNRDTLDDLIQSCSHLEQYVVQATSFSKLKRKVQLVDKSISIVTKQQVLNEYQSFDKERMTIIIEGLPFLPLNSSFFHTKIAGKGCKKSDIFNDVALPKMCEDFYALLQHLKEFYCLDNIYLFDNRVFTATYAPRLQKYLENFIKFSILT